MLDLAPRGRFDFNLEAKIYPDRSELTPSPEEFARLVLESVCKRGLQERVIFQPFDFRILHAMMALDPAVRRAGLYNGPARDFPAIASRELDSQPIMRGAGGLERHGGRGQSGEESRRRRRSVGRIGRQGPSHGYRGPLEGVELALAEPDSRTEEKQVGVHGFRTGHPCYADAGRKAKKEILVKISKEMGFKGVYSIETGGLDPYAAVQKVLDALLANL